MEIIYDSNPIYIVENIFFYQKMKNFFNEKISL